MALPKQAEWAGREKQSKLRVQRKTEQAPRLSGLPPFL